jgi:hypothetical protein
MNIHVLDIVQSFPSRFYPIDLDTKIQVAKTGWLEILFGIFVIKFIAYFD